MRAGRFVGAVVLLIGLTPLVRGQAPATGPWDLTELRKPPRVTWVDEEGPLRKLHYESEPLRGKPTRVFAYLALPAKVDGKLPAMVLVHGGGGRAFPEWARIWADRGYVALAMDLAGRGPDGKPLPDGGPDQGDLQKFPRQKTDLRTVWSYHAVAAVIRGVSLLRSLPQVDAERIGTTGISWGGYLTCIVSGLDDRLKVAVPVYGCGFLHDNSAWVKTIAGLPEDWRKEWIDNFDPSRYLKQARMPVLFVNGTNDFAYPLDSYRKSYRLVPNRQLCVTVNMPHGHPQGWAPVEIGLFVDQHLRKGAPLPRLERVETSEEGGRQLVTVPVLQTEGPVTVQLHWTTDLEMPWQKRKWQSKPAQKMEGNATDFHRMELPRERPVVWFVTLTDRRKATVSTEHVLLEKK